MFILTDTIVALATPPGEGAIGIIRLSGPEAIAIADQLFKGKRLAKQLTHTLHFGKILDADKIIDEVVISIFRGPKSYTGEDVIEISCHGSPYVLQKIIDLCLRHGARMAKPGEFTLRAFLKGKIDLTQAEAVADLIASQAEASHHAAMHNLRGGFSYELKQMREELIKFSALIELELDFSQEDVEFADRKQLYDLIQRINELVQALVDSFRLGNVIKHGLSVAIIGKPNAGKSTLLNALLNEDRAIVSDIAGTTRDTIEEVLNINGVIFRLIDTAGIREHTTDAIEKIGVQRSKDARGKADVVIYLFDVNELSQEEIEERIGEFKKEGIRYLLAGNKADKLPAGTEPVFFTAELPILFISARDKKNIDQLKDALFDLVMAGKLKQEGTIVTNARHYGALQDLLNSLHDIKKSMDENLPGDLIALDIRRSLHFLGDITGEVTTEDKLDYIFSKFCIGK